MKLKSYFNTNTREAQIRMAADAAPWRYRHRFFVLAVCQRSENRTSFNCRHPVAGGTADCGHLGYRGSRREDGLAIIARPFSHPLGFAAAYASRQEGEMIGMGR